MNLISNLKHIQMSVNDYVRSLKKLLLFRMNKTKKMKDLSAQYNSKTNKSRKIRKFKTHKIMQMMKLTKSPKLNKSWQPAARQFKFPTIKTIS